MPLAASTIISVDLPDGPGVSDLARFNGPQLIGRERHNGQRFALKRHELDLVSCVSVDQHDGPQVAGVKAVFGQVNREHRLVEFVEHNRFRTQSLFERIRRHESRQRLLESDKPDRPHARRPTGWRFHYTFNHDPLTKGRGLHASDFVGDRVFSQRRRKFLPPFWDESHGPKEERLMPTIEMRPTQQVVDNLGAIDNGKFGVGKLHGRLGR
jgi:hypothetical protein